MVTLQRRGLGCEHKKQWDFKVFDKIFECTKKLKEQGRTSMMNNVIVDVGLGIHLTQEVGILPQESKGCTRFYLNRSAIFGPTEKCMLNCPIC